MILSYLFTYHRYLNLVGILIMFAIALFFSRKRTAINWSLIAKAFAMQWLLGFCMMRFWPGRWLVESLALGVAKLSTSAASGINFMFGNLGDPSQAWGSVFAVRVLPALIFFSALVSLLFHLGVIQRIVMFINGLVRPLLGTSGPETMSVLATSLFGQTEALFFVGNYIGSMTKAELFVVMTSGMSAISMSLLSVYSTMGIPTIHLLTSVSMSIFGSIMVAKILFPDEPRITHEQERKEHAISVKKSDTVNVLEAIGRGTSDGLQVALAVGAMLVSFLSLLALLNHLLAYTAYIINTGIIYVGGGWQLPELSLDLIFSYLFAPIGYLLGFVGNDALIAGQLLGKKIAINEFIAYSSLVSTAVSERMMIIMTYALCGFSNIACIGIQMGSIAVFAPDRRAWVAELGPYAVLGGALSNLITAMIAALLL